MKQALQLLKENICTLPQKSNITQNEYQNFISKCTVALMTGGESSRFKEVPGAQETNKNAFKLPNNDTMIEMTIRMYVEAGIKNFVALVYHDAHTIEDTLGNGSRWGISIKYSHDPELPVGKGGAVKNALLNGSVPKGNSLIVHNPDDVIINYPGNFPRDIITEHIAGLKKNNIATVVIVEETPYSFTGMKIDDGEVTKIEMYPMVPIPTHIGVTIFDLKAYDYFDRMFDLNKKSDFEKELFPVFAEKGILYACAIPSNCWIAVNNLKAYKQLVAVLNTR